jgi:phage terminase large subunit GpA-like protein
MTDAIRGLVRGQRTVLDRERAARRRVFHAPPKLTVSQWAEEHRIVPSGTSPEPGPWRNARTPYLVEIMDALGDPTIEHVVFQKSGRVGATECLNNYIGYLIDLQPTSIGVMQQTVEEAKGWSKEQLDPMLQETPRLRGKVRESNRREKDNTIQVKFFPGGAIYIVGANSARGLKRRNIQVIIGDERDGYPRGARGGRGEEGDPFALFKKRAENYWDRKFYEASTPAVGEENDESPIAASYEMSDQRKYYVPCPHCGYPQILRWKNFKWEGQDPSTTYYVCGRIDDKTGELLAGCGAAITEEHKTAMVMAGDWRAERPGRPRRGYFLWAAYSLFTSWSRIVAQFLEAQGDQGKLQVFVNQVLGEVWRPHRGEQLPKAALLARREPYATDGEISLVPRGVGVLTAGVDVQGDRLEVSVWGFGKGLERWVIDHQALWGDPAKAEVWTMLDLYLLKDWIHETRLKLRIAATAVDSGGHHTDEVYRYCDARHHRYIYPVKGSSQPGAAAVQPPHKKSEHHLWMVGTDAIKDILFSGLTTDVPGPGYIHFPQLPEEYFTQLTSERVRTRYERGRPIRRYERIGHLRAEALDCATYAHAALLMLGPVRDQLGLIVDELAKAAAEKRAPAFGDPHPRRRRMRSPGLPMD